MELALPVDWADEEIDSSRGEGEGSQVGNGIDMADYWDSIERLRGNSHCLEKGTACLEGVIPGVLAVGVAVLHRRAVEEAVVEARQGEGDGRAVKGT